MEPSHNWSAFREACHRYLALDLTEKQLSLFNALYDRVIEANRVMNLTRITEFEAFCTRHLLDSLTLLPYLPQDKPDWSLIDIGSGAGFPALPLAILYPTHRIVAVESVQKKATFIFQAAEHLGLDSLEVVADRSEVIGHGEEFRERFDIAVARAVASLPVLAEFCLPFVRVGGQFIAMKMAGAVEEELPKAKTALHRLGGRMVQVDQPSIPELSEHRLLVVAKDLKTPETYPRNPGIPAKHPL